jgi:Fur family ferric uptake transcriptional regulator
MHDFEAVLQRVRSSGLRLTRQRRIILRAMCDLDGHASAEEVYQRVSRSRSDVDLSTVYRALVRLRDLRILSQIDLGRSCAEFEIVGERRHHHLVCVSCGTVMELDHSYLAALEEAVRHDFDFDPAFDHFALFGHCAECAKRGPGFRAGAG